MGVDLSERQITENKKQGKEILSESDPFPTWVNGDSRDIDKHAKDYKADLIFSCPPYADLEVYSDDPKDISNMDYKEFLKVYREIIQKTCNLLKDDRFAVFVVGEVRDKKGYYYNFVGDTIKAFIDAGMQYYNEMILINSIGSLPMRAKKYFNSGRKIGKAHQNVLVFYKGDAKKIKGNYPELELDDLFKEQDEEYGEEL